MVVDTSALIAVLMKEAGTDRLESALRRVSVPRISAVALVEATMVVLPRLGESGVAKLDALIASLGIEVVPVTRATAELARDAFRRYGKGRHPAALNFGDCFSYALAAERGEPLLFVGDDFARTDVQIAGA